MLTFSLLLPFYFQNFISLYENICKHKLKKYGYPETLGNILRVKLSAYKLVTCYINIYMRIFNIE